MDIKILINFSGFFTILDHFYQNINKKTYYSIWKKWHLSVWFFQIISTLPLQKKKKLSTPGLTLFLLIKTQTSYLGDLFQKSHSVFYQIKFGKLLDKKKNFLKINLEEAEKLWLNIFFTNRTIPQDPATIFLRRLTQILKRNKGEKIVPLILPEKIYFSLELYLNIA